MTIDITQSGEFKLLKAIPEDAENGDLIGWAVSWLESLSKAQKDGTPPVIRTTLAKVARLYDLTAEMRQIVQELHEVNVEVSIGKMNRYDPLGDATASIAVFMRPGCDLVQK